MVQTLIRRFGLATTLATTTRCYLLASVLTAAAPATAREAVATEFFDPADVRPGMRGIARTVFCGNESSEFGVELLGVMAGTRPKGDLIPFHALGDTLANIGVVAGMSGSPVYIQGKLLGAIAFAYPFSKEAIGMITPIGEMMEGLDRLDDPPAPWMGGSGVLYEPFLKAFVNRTLGPELQELWDRLLPSEGRTTEALPLISMSASGWASGIEPVFEAFSKRTRLPMPVGGAGNGAATGAVAAVDLKPGSAIGALLIDGNATLAAIGTLTYRDGDRIVAFGHPLFHAGPVQLPVTAAWIHGIVPSYNSSFKMGSAGPIVGTIRQDLRGGISADLSQTPPMLPVRIVLTGPSGAESYNYRVARGTMLEPLLCDWAASNSFLQHGWRTGDATLDARLTIHYNGSRTLTRRDRIATEAPAGEIASRLLHPVPILLTNPFERVSLDSLALAVSYGPELKQAILIDLWSERVTVRPGEILRITARLKDRHGEARELPVELQVPERWRGSTLLIIGGGAKELTEWDQDRAPVLYEPKDLAGLERLIRELPDEGDLLVRIYSDGEGVILGDRELGRLPASVERVLGMSHKRGPARPATNFCLEERRIDAGGAVSGGLAVRVRVE